MGGRPLSALAIVGFPDQVLSVDVLGEILRGGALKAKEAGIDVVGGHTIKSDEPIYGLAVIGEIHPDRIVSNAGARPGDLLVLSKPLGLGIVTTANKNDVDHLGAIGEAIRLMTTLNAGACTAMLEVGVRAATDITGFGLMGHLRNVCAASRVSARVWARPCAGDGGRAHLRARGRRTRRHARQLAFPRRLGDVGRRRVEGEQLLLSDAQTSGGLLMAVPPARPMTWWPR